MNFVAVANVSAVVLGHPFDKSRLLIGLRQESSFDWFKLHSILFK